MSSIVVSVKPFPLDSDKADAPLQTEAGRKAHQARLLGRYKKVRNLGLEGRLGVCN